MLLVDALALVNLALIAIDVEWARLRIRYFDGLRYTRRYEPPLFRLKRCDKQSQCGDVSVCSNEEVRPVRALCIPRSCWQLAVQDLFR
jgi:hypothetical protein